VLVLLCDCSHNVAISINVLALLHIVRLIGFRWHDLDRGMHIENSIFL